MTVPRKAWLDALAAAADAETIVVAGLGANARYLPHLPMRAPHFALCDAMGAAIPLALGMALARADRHVIALEGDGSLLMNLGTLATLGATAPRNLTVLLFDNRHYESSGGQDLPRGHVDFVAMARAAGLPLAERVESAAALDPALASALGAGPAFYLLPTTYDPTEPIPPYSDRPDEIRLNFARRLAGMR
jgi:thiamine pyrophosphate-dependent acetolactate synthase large subunit-like protein